MNCGPDYVIIKKGSEGAELFSKQKKSIIPAFNIKKVIGVNEDKTSLITKNNLEIKNLFSKLGIFLIG